LRRGGPSTALEAWTKVSPAKRVGAAETEVEVGVTVGIKLEELVPTSKGNPFKRYRAQVLQSGG